MPPHGGVRRYEIGLGPRSYWLFEPDRPRPDEAPVVVFLHGWFAVNPGFYGAWIDHLVRNGHVVIFPRYQNDVGTMPQDFLPNAMAAIHDAMGVLSVGVGHVRPDSKRFALIGHSAGANLAAQIAALSSDPHAALPSPRALVAIMPGEVFPMRQPSFDRIPATTLLIVAVGDEDIVVGDLRGRQIFAEASAIPPSRKRFILFRSDRHGYPPLIAEHTAPTGTNHRLDNGEGILRRLQLSMGDVNALDHAGFWRITDLTLQAGFTGKTLDDVSRDRGTIPTPRILERRPPRHSADRRHRPRRHPARHTRQRPEDLPLLRTEESRPGRRPITVTGAAAGGALASPRNGSTDSTSFVAPARWSDRARGGESAR